MAVTLVKLETIGDITEDAQTGGFSGEVSYLVTIDNLNTTGADIRSAAGIPERGVTAHPLESTAICRSRRIESVANDYKWRVVCEFNSESESTVEPPDDPEQLVVRGSQRAFSEQRPTLVDAYGNPVVNSAGDYYDGLTKRFRLREYVCTSSFFSIPDFLFELSGTVNSTWVTIHGKSYPPGTCLMGDVSHPDTPSTDSEGNYYWPITYHIEIDPDGWTTLLPNRGANALYYETRPDQDTDWSIVGFEAYDDVEDENLRQIRKGRILDDYDADLSDNIWLNQYGEKELVSLTPLSTTGKMVEGLTTLVASGFTEQMVGTYVSVDYAGFRQRPLKARIVTYNSATSVELSSAACGTVRGVAVRGGAARVNVFQLDDLADWSAVPLPNNHE